MIYLFYTINDHKLPDEVFGSYLHTLPDDLQKRILRFRNWQDAQACLFGKLLLLESLKKVGMSYLKLENLKATQYQRPFFNNDIDFNISHSGEYVVCAISENIKLGIDIEKIKPIKIDDFEKQFTPLEWHTIIHSQNPHGTFYNFWTKKESVIKADGRGMSIPLHEIIINNHCQAIVHDKIWFLKEISFSPAYVSHLATDAFVFDMELVRVDF